MVIVGCLLVVLLVGSKCYMWIMSCCKFFLVGLVYDFVCVIVVVDVVVDGDIVDYCVLEVS